jgi:general secretion pathway protein A
MLLKPELEQLAQRVVARFHLDPLAEEETAHYIKHRLSVAGMNGLIPFDREARHRIFELTRGVPRRINLLCDRALLGAYASGRQRVDKAIVDKAAGEVFDNRRLGARWSRRRTTVVAAGLTLSAMAVLAAALWFTGAQRRSLAAQHAVAASAASGGVASQVTVAATHDAAASAATPSASGATSPAASTPAAAVPASATALPRSAAASPVVRGTAPAGVRASAPALGPARAASAAATPPAASR